MSRVIEVPSRTQAGTFYQVVKGLDGSMQCNCPASFNRLECWHVRYVREEMMTTSEVSRALVPVVVQPSAALLPTDHELDVIERAAAMVYAGAVSVPAELNTKEKVAAVMLYGLELGLKPMTAIQGLFIVKGKVSASAQIMAGLCMSREKDIQFHVEKLTDKVCTIRMQRPSRRVNDSLTVTWEQIVRAGLDRNATNIQYPEDRLVYHATKRLCRIYAPDLINGLDEGVAVPGVTDAEPWRPSEADIEDELYNEGDVDRETGEIFAKHEDTQEAPVHAPGVEAVPAGVPPTPTPPASSPADEQVRQKVRALLEDCKSTWDAVAFRELGEELSIFMPGGEGTFRLSKLEGEQATACLEYIQKRRGAPAEEAELEREPAELFP